MSTPDTFLTQWPICPACGHVHSDAWEWDLGPSLDGDGEVECESCDARFFVSRVCHVSYTTHPVTP